MQNVSKVYYGVSFFLLRIALQNNVFHVNFYDEFNPACEKITSKSIITISDHRTNDEIRFNFGTRELSRKYKR